MDYDIIIIGAGPGGYETALEAASSYKMKTALVEKGKLGGTCLNRGCIPTKTFLHTAKLYDEVKSKGDLFGFAGQENLTVNMSHLQKRKEDVTGLLRDGIQKLLKSAKVDVFEGIGSIVDKGLVNVATDSGNVEIRGKHIVIATGSKPDRQENLDGHDLPGVVTSDEMLDLDRIPESLIILGGGVIGMELASVFNSLGSRVTILKASGQIFNNLDKEQGQSLKMLMKKRGIEIISGVNVRSVSEEDDGLTVTYSKADDEKSESETLSAEMVLLAKGRKAETVGLIDADSCSVLNDIETDTRGRIIVDGNFQTGAEGIYAIGDCIDGKSLDGHAQLAHVAVAEGRNLLAYINGEKAVKDLKSIPSCIYTDPEIAAVGVSSDHCKSKGMDVIVKKYPMGGNGKSVLTQQERGFIKLIADGKTKKIIGGSMMCARATDMISIITQAIVNGMTIDEVGQAVFPHPTFSEGIGEACK